MKTIVQSNTLCVVCEEKATGWHFGAITCRACAAFFRRSWQWKSARKCKRVNENCASASKGVLHCKKCRLQKCLDVGMSVESYKVDQKYIFTVNKVLQNERNIPPMLDTFLGRPNLIIVNTPSPESSQPRVRCYVDLQHVIQKAIFLWNQGVESPVFSRNALEKLAFGLQRVQKEPSKHSFCDVKLLGKDDMMAHWESDFLRVTSWLAYFDGFNQLPQCLRMTISKSVWKIWNHLATVARSAAFIRQRFSEKEIKDMDRDTVICDWSHVEYDMSWMSRYSFKELQFFIDFPTEWRMDDLTRLMVELDPSDVELSYMLSQLCFHYVGKKYQGEVMELVEKFQADLANDLHQYYVEELRRPRYVGRLATMMKINNLIQQKILRNRPKKELARVFEMIDIESSHPEMFMDM